MAKGAGVDGGAARPANVLWEASADLNGDGSVDEVQLVSTQVRTEGSESADESSAIPVRACRNGAASCTAVLHVGETQRAVKLTPGYFGGIDLSVIDIDEKDQRKELLFRRRAEGIVDPPFIFTVGIYDGKTLHWQELDPGGGYDAGEVEVSGNRLLTTEYDACSEVTTTTYQLTATGLKRLKSETKQVRDPSECAACPIVYLEVGDQFVEQGEILRNLRSAKLNGHQTLPLALPASARRAGRVRIKLREEKPETTYLDSISLTADGVTYAPIGCSTQAYCTTDGTFHRIAEGEELVLHFAIPPAEHTRLEAVGYYVPHGAN